ncbi:MAG: ArsA family ATPase [Candidatus Dormibacteria bacterium]
MADALPILDQLLRRRVIILTGKGGVGKSTTSAALALVAAQRGKKVLLVEVDAKGNLPDFFDAHRVGFRPKRLHQGIHGLSMQPSESMHEYLRLYLKVPGFSLRPLEGFIGYTSGAIPGLKEILVTGKIYWEERKKDAEDRPLWDLLIVDGAPTGHAVGQLGAARHLAGLIRSGPIHDQSESIADLLSNTERTALVLVAIPEEMPVNETLDLAGRFAEETDIVPQALIVNQLQPPILPQPQLDQMRRLTRGAGRAGFLQEHPDGQALLDAAEIMLDARARSLSLGKQLDDLGLPTLRVPYVFERHHGFAFTRNLARALAEAQ